MHRNPLTAPAKSRDISHLTELIPKILWMVDDGKIVPTSVVELSYLTKHEQEDLLETMESEDCRLSLSQANQIDKISFRTMDIRRYFPKSYNSAQIQAHMIKLLEDD